jgi:hypothetical protein
MSKSISPSKSPSPSRSLSPSRSPSRSKSPSPSPSPYIYIPPIKPPLISAFMLPKKSKQLNFGNIKIPKFNQKRAYNPSLVAREFNIKGTASRLDKMGFGIQPI